MTSFQRVSIASAAVLAVGVASLASAQTPRMERRGSPMYDVKTETTITGTVENIETITGPGRSGRRGLGGTHLVVKTATETLDVHVGPSAYLAEQKIALAKGDTVQVLGSRVTIGDEVAFLARQITRGSDRWTLRDEAGRPLWSGPRR
jgi:hypothetical protein